MPESPLPTVKLELAPLTAERVMIRDKKSTEFDDKIVALNDAKDRMIAAQAADLQKLQDQIDEAILMRDALNNLS